jgi:hypothetical protein
VASGVGAGPVRVRGRRHLSRLGCRDGPKPTCVQNETSPAEAGLARLRNRRRPTLPGRIQPSTIGAGGLNFRVRNGNGCISAAKATETSCSAGYPRSGPFENSIANTSETSSKDPSPRPISTGQLNTLLCLHFRPINVVVFHGPYLVNPVARFISRRVSRLDAFSGYLFRRFANQPCSWRNNWHTRAASVPVLSY